MKPFIRALLFTVVSLVVFVPSAGAQSTYSSLPFARESNDQNTTDYVLKPEIDEIHKRLGGADKPYRIVGVVARPSNRLAVLMFVNSQKAFQLETQADKAVVITVDDSAISNLTYNVAAKQDHADYKLEIGNILMSLDDLRKIAKGKTVSMKLGAVVHQLDSDNLSALRYLMSEIEKDEKKAN
jgi:hypothetical protein